MKKIICFILCTIMLFTVAACGTEKSENSAEQQTAAPSEAEQASFEWTREGYFQDENENMLSVTWMEDIDEPGWYVGCMLGEDSWGGRKEAPCTVLSLLPAVRMTSQSRFLKRAKTVSFSW